MLSTTYPWINRALAPEKLHRLHYHWMLFTFLLVPLSTSLSTIAYLILALSSLFQITEQKRWQKVYSHPITKVCWSGIFLVILGFSYTHASWALSFSVGKKYFWLLVTPLLLVSIDRNTSEKEARHPYTLYLIVIAITLFLAFYRISTVPGYFHDELKHPMNNVFKDHIIQSLLFAIGFAISFFRLLDKTSTKKPVYALFCILLVINVFFASDGRTGYILLPLILIYTVGPQYSYKKTLLILLISLFVFSSFFLFSPIMQKRWHNIVHSLNIYQTHGDQKNSLNTRLNNWRIGLNLFKAHPLMGYGTGGIQEAFHAYLLKHPATLYSADYLEHGPAPIIEADKLLDSSYLNFTLQYGLFGLIFCFWFLASLWQKSEGLSPFDKYLARVILLSLIPMLWIQPWLSSSAPTHLISLLLALLYARKANTTHQDYATRD